MRILLCLLILAVALAVPTSAQSEETEPASTQSEKPAPDMDYLRPSGGQLGIGGDEGFGLGTAVGDPTALYGPTRTPVVLFGTDRESLIDLTGYYAHKFSEQRRLLIEGHVDPNFLGLDLSYTVRPESWEGALTVNSWVASGSFAPFETPGFPVLLPTSDEPQVQMMGAGVEYVQPFTQDLDVAFGLNYHQYAFSNELLTGDRFRTDINWYPLTVTDDSPTERFVSLRVNGLFSTLNDRNLPTEGTKIRFGLEQAIDLGSSSTSFNRLSANIAQLFEMPGFTDGDHTLLLNLQAGTILGDPPSIRAFHLGGAQSVRGYDPGELASGKSFLQTSVEYRHHLKTFTVFDNEIHARLALFHDYGTVLGTANQLQGIPPALFNKEEHGYGYGAGLQFASEYGLFRLESAWNGRGRNTLYFTVGERF